jgi:hypothetical protein
VRVQQSFLATKSITLLSSTCYKHSHRVLEFAGGEGGALGVQQSFLAPPTSMCWAAPVSCHLWRCRWRGWRSAHAAAAPSNQQHHVVGQHLLRVTHMVCLWRCRWRGWCSGRAAELPGGHQQQLGGHAPSGATGSSRRQQRWQGRHPQHHHERIHRWAVLLLPPLLLLLLLLPLLLYRRSCAVLLCPARGCSSCSCLQVGL